jgi:hypothetical protein
MTYLEHILSWALSWAPYYLLVGVCIFVVCEFLAARRLKFRYMSDYIGAMVLSAVMWPFILCEVIIDMWKERDRGH